jgi:protein TonB
MTRDRIGSIDAPAPRRRVNRVLMTCLWASVAVHAGVIVLVPRFFQGGESTQPNVLEVKLVPPQPLPMAPSEPDPQPEAQKASPHRKPAKAPPRQQDAPKAAMTSPEPHAPMEESGFSVPAPRPADPSPAPEQKSRVASAPPPVTGAAYLRNPAPIYPLAARRAGEQGTVMLRVQVTTEGLPARVDLQKSSGSAHLDRAAIETVKGWRFKPARRGAEAVEGWVDVPVVFNLKEAS